MSTSLRVVSLQAQNIMRLSAVEIAWNKDQSTLTIGGRNGAGKSSVLNAVAMALGGKELCLDEPIRSGESAGFVEVNLGELVVRRDFSREKIVASNVDPNLSESTTERWSETKSRITVKNAEGIRLGTPQSILDKLIGRLSFDPLAFAAMSNEGADGEKRQAEILRQIVGLDTSKFDEERKAAAERRAHWNREHKAADARLAAMKTFKDAGLEEVPMGTVGDEMLKAEECRRLADEADRAVSAAESRFQALEAQCQTRYARIDELNKQIAALQGELAKLEAQHQDEAKNIDALKITAQAARAVVPDMEALRKRVTEVEETNAKARANKSYAEASAALDQLALKAKAEDGNVKQAEQAKADALLAAKFPVEGLGVDDAGVTFNGIPFKQASTAEQIKVSVAVGFALNPGLKLLLVRNGNALDEDSLKAVAAQAEEAHGQLLIEFVTKDASQVSVMIEDGKVV